jgi:hypothetical protein
MLRNASLSALSALIALVSLVLLPTDAYALNVSRAELRDGQLRVEGANAAPGVFVTVESSTSSAGIRSDSSGAYRVAASNFRADDCTVVVSDRRTLSATVTLSGCTPTPATPPSTNPAPTGSCLITAEAPATYNAGDLETYYFHTTGCDTSNGPVQWAFLAGRIPVGMTGPSFQGQDAGAISGRPTTEGTYQLTVQVTDSAGATDTETFEITVIAPRTLTITNPSVDPGAVNRSYWVILRADGGVPGYLWTLRAGALPPGLQLTSRGDLAGTPSTAGTYSFTAGVSDSRGTTADRTYSITIG